ncbi:hypothetical protein F4778DRAFT_783645 [Xylariomycetidae sp. FL2044]|nr:hypothetical protein F4778DRAFT_783645 [Xylariomycetidae sp. FL2044]
METPTTVKSPAFPLFTSLPPEIRLMVWKHWKLPDNTVIHHVAMFKPFKSRRDPGIFGLHSDDLVDAVTSRSVIQVNHEARSAVLRSKRRRLVDFRAHPPSKMLSRLPRKPISQPVNVGIPQPVAFIDPVRDIFLFHTDVFFQPDGFHLNGVCGPCHAQNIAFPVFDPDWMKMHDALNNWGVSARFNRTVWQPRMLRGLHISRILFPLPVESFVTYCHRPLSPIEGCKLCKTAQDALREVEEVDEFGFLPFSRAAIRVFLKANGLPASEHDIDLVVPLLYPINKFKDQATKGFSKKFQRPIDVRIVIDHRDRCKFTC